MPFDYKITDCSKSAWGSINNAVKQQKGSEGKESSKCFFCTKQRSFSGA